MAKTKAATASKGNRRPVLQIVACYMLNLASNICAPLFPPAIGVGLVFLAVVCWLVSFYLSEKWIKAKFKEAPVTCVIAAILLFGLAGFTAYRGYAAYRHEWTAHNSVPPKPPCPAGPASATGNGNVVISGCDDNVGSDQSK